jgi:hypothetical protein
MRGDRVYPGVHAAISTNQFVMIIPAPSDCQAIVIVTTEFKYFKRLLIECLWKKTTTKTMTQRFIPNRQRR